MLARIHKAMEEKEEGFTLIELLVVVIIIGILAAIAIPVFLSQRKKGWDAQAKSDLRNAATAEETYLSDKDVYTTDATSTGLADPAYGFKETSGVLIGIALDAASSSAGYCMVAQSKSGNFFVYNSENGGLDKSAYSSLTAASTADGGKGACPATLPTPA